MKWTREGKWIVGGLGLSLLLMGAMSLISYHNVTRLTESSIQVKQTNQVLKTLTEILTSLTEAESGRRGYILSGNKAELDRYSLATERINPNVEMLQQQIAKEPNQQQRLVTLKSLINQRLALSKRSIDLYEKAEMTLPQAAFIAQINRNRNQIRQVIAQIQTQEEQSLQQQVNQSQSSIRSQLWIDLVGTFLSFAILLSVYVLLYKQMAKRQHAEAVQRTLAQEKELGELKLNFFSMVSHEFRTPLSIILGSAQLMAESDQQWTGEKRLKNLNRIQSSAKLMTQLLTDILTLTRAEAGKLEFNPEWMDLESFCLNLVEDLQLSDDRRHSIQFTSHGGCTQVRVDEKLLYSILSNLLSNAIKYSSQGSTVYFTLTCEPEAINFQIKDEGIGISPDDLRSLYKPFHRSKQVGNIAGSGLGLAVVKKCIDLHQGEIAVESTVGAGTTFTVKIPQS